MFTHNSNKRRFDHSAASKASNVQTLLHYHVSRSHRCAQKSQEGLLLRWREADTHALKAKPGSAKTEPICLSRHPRMAPTSWYFHKWHPIPSYSIPGQGQGLRELYVKVVIGTASRELLLEDEVFAHLLVRHTVVLENQSVLFKLFDLDCPASTPEGLIVTHEGDKYLSIDCLQEPLAVLGS
jgi:hypothetical protein